MVRSLIIICIFFFFREELKGQPQETAPDTYILFLKDKKHNSYNIRKPAEFLTQRAIDRRSRQHIDIDSSDLPVSAYYTDSLRKTGLKIHNVSRWFNSVTFKTNDAQLLQRLNKLNFVGKIERTVPLKFRIHHSPTEPIPDKVSDSTVYGLAYRQIHVHNGEYLHNLGFKGENMRIAIIDAGFSRYTSLDGFQNAISENRIVAIRDFVDHDGEIVNDHEHGTEVFSIIGSEIDHVFLGTCPKAEFLLLRSENATSDNFGMQSEYLVEEDNWIAAAEYADSLGTDLINTSLGYSTFNDPLQSHTYQDMNGSTTRISRAAELATKKGMIVVVSAGNEGDNPWKYIAAPADARDVIAVGAVNYNLARARFSSVGPTADNRIKPDVMAVGQGTVFQSANNTITAGSGTSFAAPVIAGLSACLWQGAKHKTNLEVIRAIRKSSNLYLNPDNMNGYGIPDFRKAMLMLNQTFENEKGILVFPDPFSSHLTLIHKALKSNQLTLEIYNIAGRKLYTRVFPVLKDSSGELDITDLSPIPGGMVLIRVISGDEILTTTAIKL